MSSIAGTFEIASIQGLDDREDECPIGGEVRKLCCGLVYSCVLRRSRMGIPADALDPEDITQEVLFRYFRAAERGSIRNWRRWLAGASEIEVRRRLRELGPLLFAKSVDAADKATTYWSPIGGEGNDWGTTCDVEEPDQRSGAVRAAVKVLPQRLRDVVTLRYFDGCRSWAETAQELGLSAEAVRKRWTRARARLQLMLAETMTSKEAIDVSHGS